MGAQECKRASSQQCEPVFGTLTQIDADAHALAVDIGDLQVCHFAGPQACGVDSGKDGAVAETGSGLENSLDLSPGEDDGETPCLLGSRNVVDAPGAFEDALIQDPQGAVGLADVGLRQGPVVDQEVEVLLDMFLAEPLERLAEMALKLIQRAEVDLAGARAVVLQFHVNFHLPA